MGFSKIQLAHKPFLHCKKRNKGAGRGEGKAGAHRGVGLEDGNVGEDGEVGEDGDVGDDGDLLLLLRGGGCSPTAAALPQMAMGFFFATVAEASAARRSEGERGRGELGFESNLRAWLSVGERRAGRPFSP
jgi:hypothetical protein